MTLNPDRLNADSGSLSLKERIGINFGVCVLYHARHSANSTGEVACGKRISEVVCERLLGTNFSVLPSSKLSRNKV